MSGYAGPVRPVLRTVPDEPDQVRLARFRAAHPGVVIGADEFGNWQARIPAENGETALSWPPGSSGRAIMAGSRPSYRKMLHPALYTIVAGGTSTEAGQCGDRRRRGGTS
ncbi:MAG: hypothetical protein ACRDOH_07035 [Streptosporangiaceae bacterium]